MMDNKRPKRPSRIVVKLGTNLLTGGKDALDLETIGSIFAQISSVKSSGIEVLIVSSGAVAAGRESLAARRAKTSSNEALSPIDRR